MRGGETQQAIQWLAAQQLPNGSFASQVSNRIEPFTPESLHYHTFFTSIILVCLQNLANIQPIIDKGVKFLKQQQSPGVSWNYWDRHSQMASKFRFPDDLDDTAYALLALSIYDPDYIDGQNLANLAKLLIANEIKPGGPYRTWLVDRSLYGQWGDIDLAINANIGGLLSYHGLKMSALDSYVQQELNKGEPQSLYYQSPIPIIYFLSRWYNGPELKDLFKKYLSDAPKRPVTEIALLLTVGCRLQTNRNHLRKLHSLLMQSWQTDHWPAAAFYTELTHKGQACYTGSPALSTALALEAIIGYEQKLTVQTSLNSRRHITALKPKAKELPVILRKPYLQIAKLLSDSDKDRQITDMAGLTAAAYEQKIDTHIRQHLNAGSLNGWIAYKYYDDFYDQEAEPASLAVANHAHRQTIKSFWQALPQHLEYQAHVLTAMDKMDAANYWEVQNARAQVKHNVINYSLPNYGSLSQLAERSWGHTLAATGVLVALGYGLEGREIQSLQKFFKHYIIARQLNDDAHDVFDDLSRGHLSAAAVMLLKGYHDNEPLDLVAERKALQVYFWRNTIHEVAPVIYKHLKLAAGALRSTGMVNQAEFQAWLDKLEQATRRAEQGSKQTADFIINFNKVKD